ncbi:hypothetical protein [Peribacillus frigoritolerans]|uniref:hypothetical protein n=1 Tax=Peribacillus frigoritolerans TaxID=450367 RepID=UPI0039A39705
MEKKTYEFLNGFHSMVNEANNWVEKSTSLKNLAHALYHRELFSQYIIQLENVYPNIVGIVFKQIEYKEFCNVIEMYWESGMDKNEIIKMIERNARSFFA